MLPDLRYRFRALFRRKQTEREMAEEMGHHAAVHGQFAESEAAKEACRDARGVSALETVVRDVKLAARSLWHAPGFSVPALLTLALGLGAAVAIFSVADAVLLQPLPYAQAGGLVQLRERIPLLAPVPVTVPASDISEMRSTGTAFHQIGSFEEEQRDLSVGADPAVRIASARVSASMFPMLGASPWLGHNFTATEDQPGHAVAILSYAVWQKNLNRDPQAVGRNIRLDGELYTVVGVMPAGFVFPPRGLTGNQPAAVFIPMAFTQAELSDVADNFDYTVLARLQSGATLAEARAQMEVAAGRILATWEKKLGKVPGLTLGVTVDPLRELVVANSRTLMQLLLGAAGLLLLLSCANVANLFLVRAGSRRREWSLRAALGAGRGRLLRQSLTESTLLALVASGTGVLLAWAALRGLTAAAPATLPQVQGIGLNGGVLAFAVALALVVGPVCGVLPAWSAARADLNAAMREGAPSLAGGGREARLRSALVAGQVALAFVLLCGAGLLVRSFVQAESGGAGVDPAGVTTASVLLPQAQYAQAGKGSVFYQRLAAVLSGQPGVAAVAASSDLPTASNWKHIFSVYGQPAAPGAPMPMSAHTLVLGRYFLALGVPLLRGRGFTPQEVLGGSHVVIVSEALAQRYWPRGNALGQRICWGLPGPQANWLTIVGVVGNVKQAALDQPVDFHTYAPYAQSCGGMSPVPSNCRSLHLAVRTRAGLVVPLRQAVRAVDAGVPVTEVRGLKTVLDASLTPRRFNTLLITTFGGAALLLAAVGLYGVLAYAVAGRRREIAVRMALGAHPSRVVGMVLGLGGRLLALGLVAGGFAAWTSARVMHAGLASLLYHTAAFDPLTWLGAACLLALVSLAACLIPARRASRVSPLRALREE